MATELRAIAGCMSARGTRVGNSAFMVGPLIAFVSSFVLGAAYFIIVTALSTTLQMRVPDEVRGRVMGLWMMAWAGLVPLGGLIAGPIIDGVGITAVLVFGAIVAAVLDRLGELGLGEGDVVLVKGSRVAGLERVAEALLD